MTVDRHCALQPPAHVAWVDTVDGLHAIGDTGTTLAVYPRRPDRAITAFMIDRALADFRGLRLQLPAQNAGPRIALAMSDAGVPPSSGRRALIADLAGLAALTGTLSGASTVSLRLDRITDDACRLFHPDNVAVRLVCTYHGPATQWLPEESCDRSGVGSGDNERICRDWSRVQSLRPFWLGVMKGDRWPGHTTGGLLHRSPPLARGDWRLFLSIDPVIPAP